MLAQSQLCPRLLESRSPGSKFSQKVIKIRENVKIGLLKVPRRSLEGPWKVLRRAPRDLGARLFSRRPRRPGSELTRRIDRSAKLGHRTTRPSMPSSHHHLGSSSWTSRSLCFPDSRDLEVLGGLSRQREREGGGPQGILPRGLSLCQEGPPRTSRSRESGKQRVLEVRDNGPK